LAVFWLFIYDISVGNAMEVFIKVAPRHYEQLRSRIPSESPAHEAIEHATRIDHALAGVLFEGYSIPCNGEQAEIILETAKKHFPEIVSDIEQAMTLARPR
jgi:hypothetical protein